MYPHRRRPSKERRQLLELIERRGGSVKARDLMRSSRTYSTAVHAELALADLAKAGIGKWVGVPPGSKGGTPTREFVLDDTDLALTVDTTPEIPGKSEVVSTVNLRSGC